MLKDEEKQLTAVEIVTKKVNVANSIIKKVQKNIWNQFENYSCNTYLKTGLERENRRITENDMLKTGPTKMNLIEAVSVSTFITPITYHEKIIAKHDYSNKEASTTP